MISPVDHIAETKGERTYSRSSFVLAYQRL